MEQFRKITGFPNGAGEGKMMTFGIGMLRYRLLKLEFNNFLSVK